MQPQQSTLCHSQNLKLKCKQKPELQSINKLYNEQDGSECSYCHKGKSYTWGLVAENYEPYTYQTMMERGWRRCGTYYYKQNLEKSCCKQWTHRLDVNQFRIKRDQKKTIKKMMALAYQPIVEIIEQKNQTVHQSQRKKSQQLSKKQKQVKKSQPLTSTKLITQLSIAAQAQIIEICKKLNQQISVKLNEIIPKDKINPQNQKLQWNVNFLDKIKSFNAKPQQKNDYYCNWGMLLYGTNKKMFQSVKQYQLVDFIKSIKQFVQSVKIDQNFKITLQRGGYLLIELSQKLKQQKNQEFQVIKEVIKQHSPKGSHKSHKNQNSKIQQEKNSPLNKETQKQKQEENERMQIQNQQNSSIKKKASSCHFQKLQPHFQGQLVITTDKITFGKLTINIVQAEQNNQSFKMYQRYCKQIHEKEQKGFSSYTNFLCQKALSFTKEQKVAQADKFYIPTFDPAQIHQKKKLVTGNITKRMGCYHMKYYLDDKFIAVGVIDILPNGLSSVYFYYEPQYKDKRLGVFSSIIEIQYTRYLSLTFPQFKYYYMGFYIHDNDKMSYKGDYTPYQLLCPITYNFVTVDDAVKDKVNKVARQGNPNIRLAAECVKKDPDMTFTTDLGLYIDKNIKLTYRKKPLKLKQISPEFYIPVLQLLKTYLSIWGKELFEIFTFTF